MDDWEALEQTLFGGENGEALRALADSEDARRLGKTLSAAEVGQALRSGDSEQMRSLLETILSTGEGKALAERIAKLGGGK